MGPNKYEKAVSLRAVLAWRDRSFRRMPIALRWLTKYVAYYILIIDKKLVSLL